MCNDMSGLKISRLKKEVEILREEKKHLEWNRDWYKHRVDEFRKLAEEMPEPFKTYSIDIVANGKPISHSKPLASDHKSAVAKGEINETL